jgi:hypothetical protein
MVSHENFLGGDCPDSVGRLSAGFARVLTIEEPESFKVSESSDIREKLAIRDLAQENDSHHSQIFPGLVNHAIDRCSPVPAF